MKKPEGDWYCENCGYICNEKVTFSETCNTCNIPVSYLNGSIGNQYENSFKPWFKETHNNKTGVVYCDSDIEIAYQAGFESRQSPSATLPTREKLEILGNYIESLSGYRPKWHEINDICHILKTNNFYLQHDN